MARRSIARMFAMNLSISTVKFPYREVYIGRQVLSDSLKQNILFFGFALLLPLFIVYYTVVCNVQYDTHGHVFQQVITTGLQITRSQLHLKNYH